MEKIALAAFGLTIETHGTITVDCKSCILLKFTFPERKDSAEIKAALVKKGSGDFVLDNVTFDDYLSGGRAFSLSEIHALCIYLTQQQTMLQPFFAMIHNAYEIETIGAEE